MKEVSASLYESLCLLKLYIQTRTHCELQLDRTFTFNHYIDIAATDNYPLGPGYRKKTEINQSSRFASIEQSNLSVSKSVVLYAVVLVHGTGGALMLWARIIYVPA